MEFKQFPVYPNKGISCALNNYGHKQYPFNSLDQYNSIHGVYIVPSMHSQVASQTQDEPWLLKQWNCGDLKAHSQLSTLKGVKGCAEAPGQDSKERQALVIYSNLHQTNQQVGYITFWNTFSARTSHGRLWTHKIHKTHHSLDPGEATTFPHIIFFASLHDTHI